ncbi:phage holin family protein [Rhodoferax sp. AJA081-3]|uniref:phage holin family protein n=1 Tax=Rhodoferax sp. AJA081-3 TaxID=2752316 RepID=UPI001AE0711F|nr:phage holin family protein [Rhodoferax sp. AJA081-3]QTN26633.1 phage holin family protein [Rhodoferax sp. AJA081-3]
MDFAHNKANSGGTWGAARDKAATLLSIGQTRLELLGNELEVARITITRQLLLAQALLFCVGLGVVLTVMGLVILFWEQRLVVVALAAGAVWGTALYVYFAIQRSNRHAAPLFNASLAELQEDLRQLKAATGHGRTPG